MAAVERCDLSDLPVDQCGCRKHPKGKTYDARQVRIDINPGAAGYGEPIPARYHGRCQACGDGITPGEPIRADLSTPGRAAWIHASCAD
jgi:hypothetical protein